MRPDFVSLGGSLFPSWRQKETTSSFVPHRRAATDWIREAQRAAGDGGISKGYDTLRGRWDKSYPETTGYTIPTLLSLSLVDNDPSLRKLALDAADFLLGVATPEGGVSHWASPTPNPIVFDTGQVIFGWLAAYEVTGEEKYLRAAQRAGDWLCRAQDPEGFWTTGQHLGVEKVIDTRVDWALLQLHGHCPEARYLETAVRNLDWAVSQQDSDGWFYRCSFTPTEDPFTHTLAYTAEGLLECGQRLAETRFLEAGKKTAIALYEHCREDGSLASTFRRGWRESSSSSCLTGICQSAMLWLALYRLEGGDRYVRAAKRGLRFVAGRQQLAARSAGVRGGIPGSAPFFGIYERFKYPNWAAKFFVDALLMLEQETTGRDCIHFAG